MTLVIGASLRAFLGLRTIGQPSTVQETQGVHTEAANLIVAEKQIPTASIALHGAIAIVQQSRLQSARLAGRLLLGAPRPGLIR